MSREDFGGYRLVEKLGCGGSCTVFSARYGALRRAVAIKILHPHLVGDASERRMLAEAHTLSLLDHPGIVKVLDAGIAPDGRVYVVMEHLVGEPLHVRVARGPMPEARAVAFTRQLASALASAHRAGIVHRDLKPENVFVVADPDLPGGERVKLLDFGIAKREGHEHTATGVVLGTPAYMAPEQALGSRHVDPRADIYSLGVVAYLMATGIAPFAGDDTGELLAEHAYCRPPSASDISGVSPALSSIIERCLAKRPEDRFATMDELGAALRALEAAPAPVPAPDPQAALKAVRWGERDETTRAAALPGMFGADPLSLSLLIPMTTLRAEPPPRPSGALLARGSEPRLARGSEPPPLAARASALVPAPASETPSSGVPLELADEPPVELGDEPPVELAAELAVELAAQPMLELASDAQRAPATAPPPVSAWSPLAPADWRSVRVLLALIAAAAVIALLYELRF